MAVRIMTVVCQKRRWKLCDVVNGPQKKLLMEEIWMDGCLGDTRAVVYVLFTASSQHRDLDPLIHLFIIFIKPYPFSNFNKNTMPCWL